MDPDSNEKVPHAAQPRFGATVVVATTRPAFLWHKLALLGIALFTAFIVLTVPKFFTEIRSAQWPSAAGIITQSRLRAGYFKKMQGFIPDIQYHYTVGEREFAGTQITFHLAQSIHTKDFAESWLQRYPKGKAVPVYYDPRSPAVSVLQPGIRSEQRWLLCMGFGYIVVCTVAFLWVLYDYRKVAKLAANFGSGPFVRLE